MIKRNAVQLRHGLAPKPEDTKKLRKNPIYIILDNVMDTYNVGAIFRLADAAAVAKVYLCGETETPPNHKIKKASVNTWQWVDWEHTETAIEAIEKLRSEVANIQVVAVELDKRSVAYDQFDYQFPIAVVVGHESTGVSEEVLKVCDGIVELPMYGVNVSLNVMVSLGIALYEVTKHLPKV